MDGAGNQIQTKVSMKQMGGFPQAAPSRRKVLMKGM